LTNPAATDFVEFSPDPAEIQSLVESAPTGLSNQSGQPYDPAQVAALVDASLRNIAREHVRGIDLAIDYGADLGDDSRLTIAGSASYLDARRRPSNDQPYERRSGVIFTPAKFHARGTASWTTSAVRLSTSLNYIDATVDNSFSETARIGAFTTLDLGGSFRTGIGHGLLGNLELRVDVQNLLNEEPDLIRTSDPSWVPFDSTDQSPVGRFVSFTVTKQW
jgi:hypothetical protein